MVKNGTQEPLRPRDLGVQGLGFVGFGSLGVWGFVGFGSFRVVGFGSFRVEGLGVLGLGARGFLAKGFGFRFGGVLTLGEPSRSILGFRGFRK